MSSTEGLQPQNWPELDVRYFRWEPPVYPSSNPPEGAPKGSKPRIESAFAHGICPPKLTGWDALRARNLADQEQAEAEIQSNLHGSAYRPLSESQYIASQHGPIPDLSGRMHGTEVRRTPKQGVPHWPAETQLQTQNYGSSFDSLFGPAEPERVRYGVPQQQSSFPNKASVGQAGQPFLTVQCGKFTAPVQREARQLHQEWAQQGHRHSFDELRGPKTARLESAPSLIEPQQLQEYYSAQSDLLDGLMRGQMGHNGHHIQAQGSSSGEHELGDVFGSMPLGRANSALEVPPAQSLSSPLHYMPQWQSESVPAELPNHVVNRLLMSGQHDVLHRGSWQQRSNSLAGARGEWNGLPPMPSIPDSHELPVAGLSYSRLPVTTGQTKQKSLTDSPDVNHLEELARTADVEVAHRAFLVPPHKKRGKGGRQPASDPRLDPNIDERRAKRILANRLSAARSKMKQKNQMDVLSGMIKQLEAHKKDLTSDAAEMMEVCETLEFENRRMSRESSVLEEFLRRRGV